MRLIDSDKLKAVLQNIKDHLDESGEPNSVGMAAVFRYVMEIVDMQSIIEPPPNAPLTLEELREMDGEPVWLTPLGEDFEDGWYIIISIDKQRLHCFQLYSMLFFEHYGKTWLAYRRKPEEVQDGQ